MYRSSLVLLLPFLSCLSAGRKNPTSTHRPLVPRAQSSLSIIANPSSHHLLYLLHNHLRNALSTKSLTRSKLLLLQPRQRVKRCREQQHDGSGDQACRVADERQPLDQTHDAVDARAHVVRLEAADEAVEAFGSWADAQEERDFDEDEDESGDAVSQKEVS